MLYGMHLNIYWIIILPISHVFYSFTCYNFICNRSSLLCLCYLTNFGVGAHYRNLIKNIFRIYEGNTGILNKLIISSYFFSLSVCYLFGLFIKDNKYGEKIKLASKYLFHEQYLTDIKLVVFRCVRNTINT